MPRVHHDEILEVHQEIGRRDVQEIVRPVVDWLLQSCQHSLYCDAENERDESDAVDRFA